MRRVTDQDIQNLSCTPETYVAWVEDALRLKREASLPPKIHMDSAGGRFYNVMPVILPSLGAMACKVVNRYPGREPALRSDLLLYDFQTGDLLALMDADRVTALRTGAVAAQSMLRLARPGAERIALIGLGTQMFEALRIYLGIRLMEAEMPELEIRLLDYKGRAPFFQARLTGALMEDYRARAHGKEAGPSADQSGLPGDAAALQDGVVPCDEAALQARLARLHFSFETEPVRLVSGADIVVSAPTYLAEDLLPPEAFSEGVLLVPIHTRGYMACDRVFDKIVGDDRGHLEGFRYFHEFRDFQEMTEILLGERPGRESAKERIIAYNIGLSLHDLYFAKQFWDRLTAEAEGRLKEDALNGAGQTGSDEGPGCRR